MVRILKQSHKKCFRCLKKKMGMSYVPKLICNILNIVFFNNNIDRLHAPSFSSWRGVFFMAVIRRITYCHNNLPVTSLPNLFSRYFAIFASKCLPTFSCELLLAKIAINSCQQIFATEVQSWKYHFDDALQFNPK